MVVRPEDLQEIIVTREIYLSLDAELVQGQASGSRQTQHQQVVRSYNTTTRSLFVSDVRNWKSIDRAFVIDSRVVDVQILDFTTCS
ncbi:hypothetical protein R1flu_009815 [Riccia fluitans]|uniref:Uncharacterized protein n=1 Tax=Riccia fluitans TaxID=41844 RepID=A0ABD1Z411_9MARC